MLTDRGQDESSDVRWIDVQMCALDPASDLLLDRRLWRADDRAGAHLDDHSLGPATGHWRVLASRSVISDHNDNTGLLFVSGRVMVLQPSGFYFPRSVSKARVLTRTLIEGRLFG